MNTNIIQTIDAFAIFVGLIGVVVILTGVLHGLYHFISLELGTKSKYISHDAIRYRLGVYLLLGLEFLVAADIIETVFKPSLEQLGVLGGIVIIRTLLNYFLNKELEHIKHDQKMKNET
ncbi:DUF1622 domain-containing protein [Candidatus Peribacteria bacterium]|nr:DUF1622 domain-containing protein [Candidatus Peribacteria bacterium]